MSDTKILVFALIGALALGGSTLVIMNKSEGQKLQSEWEASALAGDSFARTEFLRGMKLCYSSDDEISRQKHHWEMVDAIKSK